MSNPSIERKNRERVTDLEQQLAEAREQIQQHQALLSSIFEADPGGLAVLVGPNLTYAWVNEAYRALTPHPEIDPLGRAHAEIWPVSEGYTDGRPMMEYVLTTGKPVSLDQYTLPSPDGSAHSFIFHVRKIEWQGQPGVLAVLSDTTRLARAMAEAVDARQTLETMLEYIPEGVTIVDAAGKVKYISRFGADLVAQHRSAIEQRPLDEAFNTWSIITSDDVTPQTHRAHPLRRALQDGEVILDEEAVLKNGQDTYVLSNAGPILNKQGEITGAVATWSDITARKQVEIERERLLAENERQREQLTSMFQELQTQHQQTRAILDSISDGFFALNREWRFTFANQVAYQMGGLSRESYRGKTIWELWPKLRGTALEGYYRQAMETGVPVHFQTEGFYSGSWYEVYAYPSDEGLSIFFTDKTEQNRAEKELVARTERLALLSEAAGAFLRQPDPLGILEHIFGRLADLLGLDTYVHYSLSTDQTHLELAASFGIPDSIRQRLLKLELGQAVCGHVALTRQPYVIADVQNTTDPQAQLIRSLNLTAYACYPLLVGDRLLGTLSFGSRTQTHFTPDALEFMRTIADLLASALDRKQAELELQQSEARLRRLVEANIIGVVTRNTAGQIKEANDAYLDLIGYRRAELQAGKLHTKNLVPAEYQPLETRLIEEVVSNGASKVHEKEYIRKDGQRVPVLVGYTRVDGQSDDLIGFVLDLTELKQTQAALIVNAEKLQRSNQELEQFAFVASHDLQEPLRKIMRFGDSLANCLKPEMDETSAAEAGNYLRRMQNAAERMHTMINGLLDLSRVTTHGKNFEQVNLGKVMDEVVSDLEERIQATGGQVEISELPTIQADALQIRQLFQNLIWNALKFHRPDVAPMIEVSGVVNTFQKPPAIIIAISDNGIGFDQQYAAQIFQPFQRLHGRSEFEGTGLGLAICQKIVERHHGKIEAHSRPGEGSTFVIHLPIKQLL